MRVAGSVVSNHGVPQALVDGEGPEDGDGVVDLVVVADPRADKPPGGLPCRVSTQEADLGGLTA